MKESFLLYTAHYSALRNMTQEQKGDLLDALFQYAGEEERPEIADPMVNMAFTFMQGNLDRNSQKYEKKCKRMKELAKKRWGKDADGEDDTENDTEDVCTHKKRCARMNDDADAYKKNAYAENAMHNDNDNDKYKETKVSYEFIDNKHTNGCMSIPENPEIDANAHKGSSEGKKGGKAALDYTAVMDYWNAQADRTGSPMRRVTKMTPVRKAAVRARVTDNDGDTSAVFKAIDMAMRSDYMNGRGKEGWVATFDWMMNPKNFQSVLEGSYSDVARKAAPKAAAQADTPVAQPAPKSPEELDEDNRRMEAQKKAEAEHREQAMRERMREYMAGAVRNPTGTMGRIIRMKLEDGTLARLGLEDEWREMQAGGNGRDRP